MKCVPDIIYQPQRGLSLDLYVPDTLTAEACVIYVHGGGFQSGSKVDPEVAHFAKRLTDEGFALASIECRLNAGLSDVTTVEEKSVVMSQERSDNLGFSLSDGLYGPAFYAAVEDLSAAIAFIKSDPHTLGVGSDKVGVLGVSSGGIAALSTVFKPRQMEDAVTSPDAVVAIAAALVQPWRMMAGAAPCLLINGEDDPVVGIEDARFGQSRAQAMGAAYTLLETGVKGHLSQVDVVLDQANRNGTPYFDLVLSHFDGLRRAG